MSGRADLREGRRLDATALNRESEARVTDAARHIAIAHSGGTPAWPRLVGSAVTHPAGGPSVEIIPDGPASGTRLTLLGVSPELELAVRGMHHAARRVTGSDAPVVVRGLRLSSRPLAQPSVPWSIRALDVPGDDGTTIARELRIELAAPPGTAPSESRVTFGTVTDAAFVPAFVVDAAGAVTVDGDLEVAGSVSQGEIPPDPADPRFVAKLADLVARRVVGAAASTAATVLGLQVTPDDTAADRTPITISITPTRVLTRWGVALEIQREGEGASHFRLVAIRGPAAASTKVDIDTAVPWSPPLTSTTRGRVVVAVVAYDTSGTAHGRRATTALLDG